MIKEELTCIYQPSEATVSSDQVKTLVSTLWMLDLLQSVLQLLHAEIDCLHTVEKQKTARVGGKAGNRACQTNLVRGHKKKGQSSSPVQ